MQLSGPFADMSPIEKRFTGEGADTSPGLRWDAVPEGTQSLALICDDPDAPSPSSPAADPWVHWVIVNIPAESTELPEGIERQTHPRQVVGAIQGVNSWPRDNLGYRGPMPPPGSGKHRYFFKLYALDGPLAIEPAQATKAVVMAAMRGHILATGQLIGTYERP